MKKLSHDDFWDMLQFFGVVICFLLFFVFVINIGKQL